MRTPFFSKFTLLLASSLLPLACFLPFFALADPPTRLQTLEAFQIHSEAELEKMSPEARRQRYRYTYRLVGDFFAANKNIPPVILGRFKEAWKILSATSEGPPDLPKIADDAMYYPALMNTEMQKYWGRRVPEQKTYAHWLQTGLTAMDWTESRFWYLYDFFLNRGEFESGGAYTYTVNERLQYAEYAANGTLPYKALDAWLKGGVHKRYNQEKVIALGTYIEGEIPFADPFTTPAESLVINPSLFTPMDFEPNAPLTTRFNPGDSPERHLMQFLSIFMYSGELGLYYRSDETFSKLVASAVKAVENLPIAESADDPLILVVLHYLQNLIVHRYDELSGSGRALEMGSIFDSYVRLRNAYLLRGPSDLLKTYFFRKEPPEEGLIPENMRLWVLQEQALNDLILHDGNRNFLRVKKSLDEWFKKAKPNTLPPLTTGPAAWKKQIDRYLMTMPIQVRWFEHHPFWEQRCTLWMAVTGFGDRMY